jgi:hypothetical protein
MLCHIVEIPILGRKVLLQYCQWEKIETAQLHGLRDSPPASPI